MRTMSNYIISRYGRAENDLDIGNNAGTQLEKKPKLLPHLNTAYFKMNMSTSQDVL